MPYTITTPVPNQPIPSAGFGAAVISAVNDLDSRISALEAVPVLYDQRTSDSATIATSALVSVLQVNLPVVGTYVWDMQANFSHPGSAGKPGFALGGTCTPVSWRWTSGTTHYRNLGDAIEGFNSSGTTFPSTGLQLTNAQWTNTTGFSWMSLKGTITISAIGTLQWRFSELVASGTIFKAGSMVTVQFAG